MNKEIKAGERIRAYRERNDWSVWDLAQKSGVEEKEINAIEKGEKMPALGVLVKLSRALGQRLGTFMDDQFKPDPVITRAADLAAGAVGGRAVSGTEYTYQSLALGKPDRHMDPFHIVLKPGDTAYYNSVVNHALRALGGQSATIYGIVYFPA